MGVQLMDNAAALRMFFTDDIYLVGEDIIAAPEAVDTPAVTETAAGGELVVPPPSVVIPVAPVVSAMPVIQETPAIPELPVIPVVPVVAESPVHAAVVSDGPIVASPIIPAAVLPSPVFKYVGKNQKHVLILVNDMDNEVSTERGRELLRNIVKAIQLSASDFALVNYSAYQTAQFAEFNSFFSCRLVLAFGIAPLQIGLGDYPQHQLVMEGNVQMVFSENLDLLAVDQNGKKTLWGSLKKLSI